MKVKLNRWKLAEDILGLITFTTAKYTLSHAEVFTYLRTEINKTNKMTAVIKLCIQKADCQSLLRRIQKVRDI